MRWTRISLAVLFALPFLATPLTVEAQQARVYRLGVILHGGTYLRAIDGVRDGLRDVGFEEGKHFVLHVRDVRGDLKMVEGAARGLEQEKVDVIYTVATSVTLAAKRATTRVPIVFYAATDPVAFGLVDSYRRPGGRLTGVHGRFTDLTAKRLQLLKEMVPTLRRAVTFYNPENPAARESINFGRDAARQLNVKLIERRVASVKDLLAGVRALRSGEVDGFFHVADAMVNSQAEQIVDALRGKNLPTMFADRDSVAKGALAGYGVSYYALGRVAARQIQRVLLGADPADVPVEQLDRVYFVVNLKTAKALGLAIPHSVLARVDEVIE